MKRRMCSMILTGILVLALSACGGDSGSKKEQNGEQGQNQEQNQGDKTEQSDSQTAQVADELIVLTGSDASTFDPHFCTDSATEIFNKNIFNNLVRFNEEMEIEPDLAKEWSVSEDQLTWTFKLEEGVKFHDGTDFNAEAVKTSFERVLDESLGSPRRSVLAAITKIEAVDEYTVNISTDVPCGALLQQLCHPVAAVISPKSLEDYGEDISTHPVGTGAFKFVEWKTGEELVLERNTDYFKGAPAVEKVYFRVVPEDATRALLLQSGQADVALRLPVTETDRLESDPNVTIQKGDTVMTMYVALNNSKGVLKDEKVRQAMNYAVDKDVIVNDILGGMATVSDSPISPYTWGYNSSMKYACDVEKAKELLTEAGYPDGIELELWTPVGRYLMDTQVCENLQAQWEKAGIHVNIRQWEFQALMSEVKNGGFDMVLLGWSPSTGDADQGLYPVFHSSQFPPNSNRAFYNNPDVDALLDQAKTEVDETARREMYAKAEKTIMEDAAWAFLYYPKQALSYRSNISGIEMLPTEHIMLEKVTKQ